MSQTTETTAKTIQDSTADPHKLARRMGLFALVVYGVGDMVGAGIYGTVGKAAGQMGNAVWLAFVASMVVALLTGMSYATIASRYPRAAGAAYVTHRAFRRTFLSYFVGLAVTASGLTSMATSTNAFSETLHAAFLPGLPVWLIIIGFLVAITLLNLWGIRESMWGNLVCTSVEVGGLLLIIALGMRYWGSVNYLETPHGSLGELRFTLASSILVTGAVLTFFSFVGFEDMLNVAEEVKNPVRTMPLGILLALGITTLLYILVSITAVSVMPYQELAQEAAPFEPVSQRVAPWLPPQTYSVITMFAVANTALINYIMGSRLLYGMGRQGLCPRPLAMVLPGRRTPHVAILTLFVLVLGLALAGRIELGDGIDAVRQLAIATSLLLLGCFGVVNLSLVVLKLRPGEPRGSFEAPIIVPILGTLICTGLVIGQLWPKGLWSTHDWSNYPWSTYDWRPPLIAAVVGVVILILYFTMRPTQVIADDDAHAFQAESGE